MRLLYFTETSGPNSSATTAARSTGNLQPTTAKTAESVNTTNCDTPKRGASSVPPKQHKRPRHE